MGGARARSRTSDRSPSAPLPQRRSARATARRRYTPPALDPAAPTGAAVRLLLRSLLETVRSCEQDLPENDPEAVHDLRVAVRRARCMVGQLRGALAGDELERLREDLRWLGALTGPSRDRDVLHAWLETLRPALAPDEGPAFDALVARVSLERDQARRDLLEGWGSARLERSLDEWERIAVAPERRNLASPDGDRPIGEMAAKAIDRAWRRLVRHGRAVSDGAPAEALHRVRIDGKKIRYLLELFRSAYPSVDLGPTITALKALQDCLGELNDAANREQALRRLAHALADDGAAADTLLVAGRLMERARGTGAAARARFPERFAVLAAKDNRRRIRGLSSKSAV